MQAQTAPPFDTDTLLGTLTPETYNALKGLGPEDLGRHACDVLAVDLIKSSFGEIYEGVATRTLSRILSDGTRPLAAGLLLARRLARRGVLPPRARPRRAKGGRRPPPDGALRELANLYVLLRVAAEMNVCASVRHHFLRRADSSFPDPLARLLASPYMFDQTRRSCLCDGCAPGGAPPDRGPGGGGRPFRKALDLIPGYEAGLSRAALQGAAFDAFSHTIWLWRGNANLPRLLIRHLELAEQAKPALDRAAADYYAGSYESALEAEAALAKYMPGLREADAEVREVAGAGYGALREELESFLEDPKEKLYYGVAACRLIVGEGS